MTQGSVCPLCGFRTEQLMVACPRCRRPLQHNHCKNCGRCPGKEPEKVKKASRKARLSSSLSARISVV